MDLIKRIDELSDRLDNFKGDRKELEQLKSEIAALVLLSDSGRSADKDRAGDGANDTYADEMLDSISANRDGSTFAGFTGDIDKDSEILLAMITAKN